MKGFILLETLVALAIATILLAGTSEGITHGLAAVRRSSTELAAQVMLLSLLHNGTTPEEALATVRERYPGFQEREHP